MIKLSPEKILSKEELEKAIEKEKSIFSYFLEIMNEQHKGTKAYEILTKIHNDLFVDFKMGDEDNYVIHHVLGGSSGFERMNIDFLDDSEMFKKAKDLLRKELIEIKKSADSDFLEKINELEKRMENN